MHENVEKMNQIDENNKKTFSDHSLCTKSCKKHK